MNDIIEKIKSLIIRSNTHAYSNDINELLKIESELSGYLFFLFEHESEAHRAYLDAYNTRKEKEMEKFMEVNENPGTVKSKEAYAMEETKEFRQIEIANEVLWNKLRGYRTQGNQIVDVITQKVAHLRREWELSVRK